jgi:hypothetical protein
MRGEIIFNVVLFAISIFLYYVVGTFKQFALYAKSGPDFWPRGILLGMIFLSGILLIKSITSLIKHEIKKSSMRNVQEPYRLFLVIAVSFAYAFGMGILGFLLSTILFQVIFLYLLKIKRFLSIILVSLLNTAMLYILFIQVLNMLLPTGVGVFRTFSLLFY